MMSSALKPLFDTLKLADGAPEEDIRKAYRRLAIEHHPDRPNSDADAFKEIQEAYDILTSKDAQAAYVEENQEVKQQQHMQAAAQRAVYKKYPSTAKVVIAGAFDATDGIVERFLVETHDNEINITLVSPAGLHGEKRLALVAALEGCFVRLNTEDPSHIKFTVTSENPHSGWIIDLLDAHPEHYQYSEKLPKTFPLMCVLALSKGYSKTSLGLTDEKIANINASLSDAFRALPWKTLAQKRNGQTHVVCNLSVGSLADFAHTLNETIGHDFSLGEAHSLIYSIVNINSNAPKMSTPLLTLALKTYYDGAEKEDRALKNGQVVQALGAANMIPDEIVARSHYPAQDRKWGR